jgi:hypothetical protein
MATEQSERQAIQPLRRSGLLRRLSPRSPLLAKTCAGPCPTLSTLCAGFEGVGEHQLDRFRFVFGRAIIVIGTPRIPP